MYSSADGTLQLFLVITIRSQGAKGDACDRHCVVIYNHGLPYSSLLQGGKTIAVYCVRDGGPGMGPGGILPSPLTPTLSHPLRGPHIHI